ncbi:hypothetical protein TELCIR_14188 [Teladorsagia circumcincta]|uniref:Uncharacterized protein n=1 Tax=Teladorsagia circumcincta TaxID=45464 RepID=A0A2G9U3V4_TELCI|nr:hypothetical protein TELCIR_14188 [Teladorsagia circumcincta]
MNLNSLFRVESLQEQLSNSRTEVETAKKEIESLNSERNALLKKVDKLTMEEKKAELSNCHKELLSLRDEMKVSQEKLSEAESKVAQLENQLRSANRSEPTDAGDETQIIHLRNNPFQCAVDAHSEAERERLKRKAVCAISIPTESIYSKLLS